MESVIFRCYREFLICGLLANDSLIKVKIREGLNMKIEAF